jgi:triacylglycerol lipase
MMHSSEPAGGMNVAEQLIAANAIVSKLTGSIGSGFSPEVLNGTISGLAPYQLPLPATAQVERDVAYGPHERHRLDWYRPGAPVGVAAAERTVVVFVHGGGFVGGDKQETAPLYDNVGWWAASKGIDAAVLNYRLAPVHQWPCGGEDVRQAAEFIARTLREEGIERPRIVLMGHSAGAVHVATAVTLDTPSDDIAGCILISGFYDNTRAKPNPNYFGEDEAQFARQSSFPALASSSLPLFLVVAELDPPLMHVNAVELMRERLANGATLPQFQVLLGHNHFSPAMLFNSSIDTLGPNILEFIKRTR